MATFIARSSAQLQHEQIRSHYVRSFDRTSCTQWLMNMHATDDTLCWCYGFSKAASATVNLTPADTTCSAHAVSVRVYLTRSVSESASDTHCLSDMYSPTGQVLCLQMIDPEIASVTDIDSPQTHALHALWTDTLPSPKHMNWLSPHLLHGESISVRHRVSGCIGFDIDIYWFATDFFQIKHTCTPSSRWTASACQVSMSDIFAFWATAWHQTSNWLV